MLKRHLLLACGVSLVLVAVGCAAPNQPPPAQKPTAAPAQDQRSPSWPIPTSRLIPGVPAELQGFAEQYIYYRDNPREALRFACRHGIVWYEEQGHIKVDFTVTIAGEQDINAAIKALEALGVTVTSMSSGPSGRGFAHWLGVSASPEQILQIPIIPGFAGLDQGSLNMEPYSYSKEEECRKLLGAWPPP